MRKLTKIVLLSIFSLFANQVFAVEMDHTFTNADEWAIYEAWHSAFWDGSNRNYKSDTKQPSASHRGNGARDNDYSGCSAAIWCQAIYFDMAVNAYKRRLEDPASTTTELRKAKNRMTSVYAGEKAHYVNFDFDNPNTNNGWFVYDDIQWWTCALARAYEVSCLAGDPVQDYLTYSEKAFCRVWYGSKKVGDDGSYADPADGFSGGMFWEWQPIDHANPHTDNGFKSACINFPTVIACCTLYNLVPEGRVAPTDEYPTYQTKEFYLEKAKEIYAWARAHFFSNQYPGAVADGIHGGGPEFGNNMSAVHLYNQATYIGASCLLYLITGEQEYLDNAKEAANWTKNKMCKTTSSSDPLGIRGIKILKQETGYEQGIYHAIFAQYMKLLVYDCGQTEYKSWMMDNIQYGWQTRDTSRNLQSADFLTWCQADDIIESYGGSALPAMMIMFPAEESTGISAIQAENTKKKGCYTIDGKEIKDCKKGIFIKDGKKVIK